MNALSQSALVRGNRLLRKAVGWIRWRAVKRSFPSHQRGMVGFIKELVDECGTADITHPDSAPATRVSRASNGCGCR